MKHQDSSNCLIYFALLTGAGAIIRNFGWPAAVYLLLLIILAISVSSKKYRKFIGSALGIGLLAGMIYSVLKNGAPFDRFFRTTRIISVGGLWLTSIGFVGKSRLENWESNIQKTLQNNKSDRTPESVYRKQWLIFIGGFLLVMGLLIGLAMVFARPSLSLLLSSLSVPPEMEDYVLFTALLASVILFFLSLFLWPFVGYVLIMPLRILLFPFNIADALDKTSVAERGFVIIGLVMSTIGLILDY